VFFSGWMCLEVRPVVQDGYLEVLVLSWNGCQVPQSEYFEMITSLPKHTGRILLMAISGVTPLNDPVEGSSPEDLKISFFRTPTRGKSTV
jgi:hypothetical protein